MKYYEIMVNKPTISLKKNYYNYNTTTTTTTTAFCHIITLPLLSMLSLNDDLLP